MEARTSYRRIVFFLASLGLAALACNAPLGGETPPPTAEILAPSATPEPTETLGIPETVPAALASATPDVSEPEGRPTFTPITVPTLRPSATPSNTPRPRASSTPRPTTGSSTTVPAGTVVPLRIDYRLDWRFSPGNALVSIATMTIRVEGGRGPYLYFRDDVQVEGPTFEYEWASCKGNPGTLRVESADGQSAALSYFGRPPCPTPTPTP